MVLPLHVDAVNAYSRSVFWFPILQFSRSVVLMDHSEGLACLHSYLTIIWHMASIHTIMLLMDILTKTCSTVIIKFKNQRFPKAQLLKLHQSTNVRISKFPRLSPGLTSSSEILLSRSLFFMAPYHTNKITYRAVQPQNHPQRTAFIQYFATWAIKERFRGRPDALCASTLWLLICRVRETQLKPKKKKVHTLGVQFKVNYSSERKRHWSI